VVDASVLAASRLKLSAVCSSAASCANERSHAHGHWSLEDVRVALFFRSERGVSVFTARRHWASRVVKVESAASMFGTTDGGRVVVLVVNGRRALAALERVTL